MDELERRLARAKVDGGEREKLLQDYLPFIKRQLSELQGMSLEYDDMMSLAMLTFVNSIGLYEKGRGGFLAFAAACIRNRLLDENKKQQRYSLRVVPLSPSGVKEGEVFSSADPASLEAYGREQERQALAEEIDGFSSELSGYGISFAALPSICPKQARARELCVAAAREVAGNRELKNGFLKNQKIPQAHLAEAFHISPKTVEKHRKYIVVLTVLLIGDYPGIQAFLDGQGGKQA